jgi:hypothetical protein
MRCIVCLFSVARALVRSEAQVAKRLKQYQKLVYAASCIQRMARVACARRDFAALSIARTTPLVIPGHGQHPNRAVVLFCGGAQCARYVYSRRCLEMGIPANSGVLRSLPTSPATGLRICQSHENWTQSSCQTTIDLSDNLLGDRGIVSYLSVLQVVGGSMTRFANKNTEIHFTVS